MLRSIEQQGAPDQGKSELRVGPNVDMAALALDRLPRSGPFSVSWHIKGQRSAIWKSVGDFDEPGLNAEEPLARGGGRNE
jgi:hypothetical protein